MINNNMRDEDMIESFTVDNFWKDDINEIFEQACEQWREEGKIKKQELENGERLSEKTTEYFSPELDEAWMAYMLGDIFNKDLPTPVEADIENIVVPIEKDNYEIEENKIYFDALGVSTSIEVEDTGNVAELMIPIFLDISGDDLISIEYENLSPPFYNSTIDPKLDLQEEFIESGWERSFQKKKYDFLNENFNYISCMKWIAAENEVIDAFTTYISQKKYETITDNLEALFNSEGFLYDYKMADQDIELVFGNTLDSEELLGFGEYAMNERMLINHYHMGSTEINYYKSKIFEEVRYKNYDLYKLQEGTKLDRDIFEDLLSSYLLELNQWVSEQLELYLPN